MNEHSVLIKITKNNFIKAVIVNSNHEEQGERLVLDDLTVSFYNVSSHYGSAGKLLGNIPYIDFQLLKKTSVLDELSIPIDKLVIAQASLDYQVNTLF